MPAATWHCVGFSSHVVALPRQSRLLKRASGYLVGSVAFVIGVDGILNVGVAMMGVADMWRMDVGDGICSSMLEEQTTARIPGIHDSYDTGERY